MALKDTDLGVVANNLYALTFDCEIIGGQFLNVYNSFTLNTICKLHQLKACFVEELTSKDIEELETDVPILKREKVYMTLLHCPFKQHLKCDCTSCKYDESSTFTLNRGKQFKVYRKKTHTCIFLLKD